MIRTVCAQKAETFRPYGEDFEPWTLEELWHAMGMLGQHSGDNVRFCLFIDGLDEYDGDTYRLVEVLESLRSWRGIKLCVSSRPWNKFMDAFGRLPDAGLAMEDLTQGDIRTYIREKLEESLLFRELKAKDSSNQLLIQEIIEKAHGVFIWVTLVVRSLLMGLKNADRIYDLQSRLRSFPESLEQYYSKMLLSIEGVYRKQTAETFKFALEAPPPLDLITYSLLDEENLDSMSASSTLGYLTEEDIATRQNDMIKRLNGRCKGLLEAVPALCSGYPSQLNLMKVDFLHRTVFDFLHTRDMQMMLAENVSQECKPKERLCKALLTQMKLLDVKYFGGEMIYDLLDSLVYYAGELEVESGIPPVKLMKDTAEMISSRRGVLDVGDGTACLLKFLMNLGMSLSFTEVLKAEPELDSGTKKKLLASATRSRKSRSGSRLYNLEIIKTLLENGAEVNGSYAKSTVWGDLLSDTIRGRNPFDPLSPVIECFLHYGADPDLPVNTRGIIFGNQRKRGRPADLRKGDDMTDREQPAWKILESLLGHEEAREMSRRTRSSQSLLHVVKIRLAKWNTWWRSKAIRIFEHCAALLETSYLVRSYRNMRE